MSVLQNVRVKMHVGSTSAAPLAGPIISVAGRTGTVVLSNTDISGLGTAALLDVGTTASKVVQLNGSAQLPALNGSLLTNLDIGSHINSATAKTTPVDADMLGLMDSEATNVLKKWSWANIKTAIAAALTAFARLAGVAGGQTLNGGTASGENLTLSSTANATKGAVIFGSASEYDQVNDRLGVGTLSPAAKIHAVATAEQMRLGYDEGVYVQFSVNSSGQLRIVAPLTWRPPDSITPASNGDLTFQATSNTTLTIKYKGSDGTVRSGNIALS